jgi:hypothetical protein
VEGRDELDADEWGIIASVGGTGGLGVDFGAGIVVGLVGVIFEGLASFAGIEPSVEILINEILIIGDNVADGIVE